VSSTPTIIKRPVGRPRKNPLPETRLDSAPVVRQDDWANSMVGLAQTQDKSQYTHYNQATIIDDGTLLEMYLGDGLGSRIVDVVADDMTREWIYVDEDRPRKTIFNVLDTLNAEEAYNTAIKWQRLYGGSLIIMGIMDGRGVDMPLYEKGIRNIEYLKVVDRTCVDLANSVFDLDPNSPTYGKVLKFNVRYYIQNKYVDVFIHYTRVLEFHNDPVPVGKYNGLDQNLRYWGISSLQKINEAIRDLGGISQSIVNILYDFTFGVYKFEGLAQLLSSDSTGEAQSGLVKRLNAINSSKSIINAAVLDKDEDYEKQYTTLAGLPEMVDRFMLQLSGSTGIPVTRLYGRSPAGLNATGESDLRNYYDLIEATQRNRLMPPLRKLLNLICLWKGIDPNSITVTFNSLYQLTEEEKSKIAKADAETEEIKIRTAQALVDAGCDPQKVAKKYGYDDMFDMELYEEINANPEPTEPPDPDDPLEGSDDPDTE
jgi:uncharacterized protein